MKAAYIERPGPPEAIQYADLPDPKPTGSQVLVKVGAVAVNPVDTYIRSGAIAGKLPQPFIVGCDLAGRVIETGPQVAWLRPGDRVWGSNQGLMGRQGTFSELALVDETWLYRTPDGVSDQEAAAIALVGITAHLGCFARARLRPGETLFVHGGTGGVGACVVQMAKAIGARVITTAGSPEKAEACLKAGADRVIQYHSEDEEAAVRQFAPNGVDVWFETLREPDLERIIGLLAIRGRAVLMAGRDAKPSFPVGPFYTRDCSVVGFAMFNAPPDQQRKCAEDINRWLVEGRLRPRISRLMKLSETAEAHRVQEESTLKNAGILDGKIVLVP